jgi:hypothetical protein
MQSMRSPFVLPLLVLAGCAAAPDDAVMAGYDATFRAGPFTIAPGADETFCTFVRGGNAADEDVAALHVEQSAGGHHIIVYQVDHPIDLSARPCPQGGQFGWSQLSISQDPVVDLTFPDGIGLHVRAHQQYVIETHYINATASPIEARGNFSLRYASVGTVTQRAGVYFFGSTNIDIAPGQPASLEATCSPPQPISLLRIFGHEHRYGTGVTVDWIKAGGAPAALYQTMQWDSPPPLLFSPPMALAAADALHVHCDWDNTGSAELSYPKEMCLAIGMYYPASGTLVCLNGGRRTGCFCFHQGLFDSGPGGSTVHVTVRRFTGVKGIVGDPAAGHPIYCSLFRDQDWSALGPKKGTEPYYYTYVEDAPLADDSATASLTFDDVTPLDYRAVCYMDTIAGGLVPGTGDPVVLLPPKVTAVAGQTAEVEVVLDNVVP